MGFKEGLKHFLRLDPDGDYRSEEEKRQEEEEKKIEEIKQEYDPILKFWREKGIDPKDVGLSYKAISDISPDPENMEAMIGRTETFSNYHDFLAFQQSLSEQKRKEFMDTRWSWQGGTWDNPEIFYSSDFLNRIEKEDGDLHKYGDEFWSIHDKAKAEELKDEYVLKNRGRYGIPESDAAVDRKHIENLKIKEGKIKKAEFKDFEYAKENLENEIKGLSSHLLAASSKDGKNNELKQLLATISNKTGLPENAIKEVVINSQERLKAEAQLEINSSTSFKKKLAKTALKSGIYISAGVLAGTSTAASFGITAGIGASVIAGARVLDRFITEKMKDNELRSKIEEVKKKKTEDDRREMENKLIAAIALKKKIEIDKVDLAKIGMAEKRDQSQIINEYIDEQEKAGLLEVKPEEVADYKEKMKRVLSGLDNIDRLNSEKEERFAKASWFDKIKKLEDNLAGDTSEKRTISTAALIGAGLAAREIPVIRLIISGYSGWKLGGAVADTTINYLTKNVASNINARISEKMGKASSYDRKAYTLAKEKLLNKDFQIKDPEGYLNLKKQVEDMEISLINQTVAGARNLNDDLERHLEWKNKEKKQLEVSRYIFKGLGAGLGLMLGETINESIASRQSHPDSIINSGTARQDSANVDSIDNKIISPKYDSLADASKVINVHKPINIEKLQTEEVKDIFEDKISNAELKPGQHDSVWRSTEQIFKDHAKELGYKGDLKDINGLEHWAQSQTARAINNSGDVTDKVFEGNKIVLEHDDDGNYSVKIEQSEGYKPGFLEHEDGSFEHENTSYDLLDQKGTGAQDHSHDFVSGEDSAASVNKHIPADSSTVHNGKVSEIVTAVTEEKGKFDFNLSDEKSLMRILEENPDKLYKELEKNDLKNLKINFDSKYTASEQLKIKNHIVWQILKIKEEQKIFAQYSEQYGNRPQFLEFKKVAESGIAQDKSLVANIIKGCADPGRNISTRGSMGWNDGAYKVLAKGMVKAAASKTKLLSLREDMDMLKNEMDNE